MVLEEKGISIPHDFRLLLGIIPPATNGDVDLDVL
jgi:hypothetical protein